MVTQKVGCFRRITEKKVFNEEQEQFVGVKRCLNQWDLMGLGLGSTLGAGVYLMLGHTALKVAGPSIVLSFLIAGSFILCAGACYAELGHRVPHGGSVYTYTYVVIGELPAFLLGWIAVFESALGAASVARGLSNFVNYLLDGAMYEMFVRIYPFPSGYPLLYLDYFAFAVVLIFGGMMLFGVKRSAIFINIFVTVNLAIVTFSIITGFFKADITNWDRPIGQIPVGFGSGGFLPYGFLGTLKGASLCFYGLVGFESVSFATTEARQRRYVPCMLLASLCLTIFFYVAVAIVITLAVPYYEIDKDSSLGAALVKLGLPWAHWVLVVGTITGTSASIYGALFPLPRLLNSMATDGVFFRCFSRDSTARKTPVVTTILPVIVVGILAGCVELEELVNLMCAGTLFSYTAVAVCVIILRYRPNASIATEVHGFQNIFGCGITTPSKTTYRIVYMCLTLYVVCCVLLALMIDQQPTPIIILIGYHLLAFVLICMMSVQPNVTEDLKSKTSLVPIIPCLSIYGNVCLMVLNTRVWNKLIVWIVIGLPIYFLCLCMYKKQDSNPKTENGYVTTNVQTNGSVPSADLDTQKNSLRSQCEYNLITENTTLSDEVPNTNSTDTTKAESSRENSVLGTDVENNEEKEAKVIGLIDQVLKQEEETYSNSPIKLGSVEQESPNINIGDQFNEPATRRRSVTELSDAESDASSTYQVLSKYDVIAQVHWEDLQEVNEEEEAKDDTSFPLNVPLENDDVNVVHQLNNDDSDNKKLATNEDITKIDRINNSNEICNNDIEKSNDKTKIEPYIPAPPPLDERYFTSPKYRRAFTVRAFSSRKTITDTDEFISQPRESVKSEDLVSNGNITFGSVRQANFISELNSLFKNRGEPNSENMKRSKSTGNVIETTQKPLEREALFQDLKREIISGKALQRLQPVPNNLNEVKSNKKTEEEPDNNNNGMSREELKSKLERLLIINGPNLLRPKNQQSPFSTPEATPSLDNYSVDNHNHKTSEEKNDTLHKQKVKFDEVLNSFKLSMCPSEQL